MREDHLIRDEDVERERTLAGRDYHGEIRAERDRYKAALEVATEALEPLAALASAEETRYENCIPADLVGVVVFMRDLRRARAAIAAIQEDEING